MHVTLVHIGDYLGAIPESIKRDADQALSQIEASAFETVFDRVGSFAGARGKHPFILLSDAPEDITGLRDRIMNALLSAGVRTLSKMAFTPHVTLSYAKTQMPVSAITPVRWRVDEILLIHTAYHTLARFPLGG